MFEDMIGDHQINLFRDVSGEVSRFDHMIDRDQIIGNDLRIVAMSFPKLVRMEPVKEMGLTLTGADRRNMEGADLQGGFEVKPKGSVEKMPALLDKNWNVSHRQQQLAVEWRRRTHAH